jgi:lipoprotein-anchoring transpeptidase ErfK/SrfK
MESHKKHSNTTISEGNTIENFIMDYVSIKYPNYQFSEFLYVGVERQKLFHFKGNKIINTFDISTSIYGAGSIAGSEQTPIGLHYIKSKHGHNVPLGGILQYKKYTGRIAQIESKPECTGRDEITTRVMALAGLEDGINKGDPNDSFNRNIYIHGTAEEGLIGTPASHGCIRMRNEDVVNLFNSVDVGIHVLILNN